MPEYVNRLDVLKLLLKYRETPRALFEEMGALPVLKFSGKKSEKLADALTDEDCACLVSSLNLCLEMLDPGSLLRKTMEDLLRVAGDARMIRASRLRGENSTEQRNHN